MCGTCLLQLSLGPRCEAMLRQSWVGFRQCIPPNLQAQLPPLFGQGALASGHDTGKFPPSKWRILPFNNWEVASFKVEVPSLQAERWDPRGGGLPRLRSEVCMNASVLAARVPVNAISNTMRGICHMFWTCPSTVRMQSLGWRQPTIAATDVTFG
jgi:hypothetical protein